MMDESHPFSLLYVENRKSIRLIHIAARQPTLSMTPRPPRPPLPPLPPFPEESATQKVQAAKDAGNRPEFDENGCMAKRYASINDQHISEAARKLPSNRA